MNEFLCTYVFNPHTRNRIVFQFPTVSKQLVRTQMKPQVASRALRESANDQMTENKYDPYTTSPILSELIIHHPYHTILPKLMTLLG